MAHHEIKGKKVKVCIAVNGNLTAMECHLPYGITQCYLPPDTSEHTLPYPSHTGWYSIYLPRMDGRMSSSRWLVTHRDGLPVHRQSPIHVVTEPDVEQLR